MNASNRGEHRQRNFDRWEQTRGGRHSFADVSTVVTTNPPKTDTIVVTVDPQEKEALPVHDQSMDVLPVTPSVPIPSLLERIPASSHRCDVDEIMTSIRPHIDKLAHDVKEIIAERVLPLEKRLSDESLRHLIDEFVSKTMGGVRGEMEKRLIAIEERTSDDSLRKTVTSLVGEALSSFTMMHNALVEQVALLEKAHACGMKEDVCLPPSSPVSEPIVETTSPSPAKETSPPEDDDNEKAPSWD